MGSHRHHQPRAVRIGEQHRGVLAGAQRGEHDGAQPEVLDAFEGGRPAVAVRVQHELRAALQRRVGARVHVPDDHVRLVARLHQRVGAAVDADEQRLVLRDVGPQDVEVAAVVVAAHDDQHVPALDLGADLRHADTLEEQLLLLAEIGHGVEREGVDLVRQPGPGLLELLLEDLGGEQGPGHEHRTVRIQQLAAGDDDALAPPDAAQHRLPHVVDEGDAGLEQDARAQVRVAPRHRADRVDDGADPGGDERLGADPVQVGVVDDRDLARLQPLGQVLGATVQARDTAHLRRLGVAAQEGGQSHLAGHPPTRACPPARARTRAAGPPPPDAGPAQRLPARALAASSTSSPACARAESVVSSPAIIRASSVVRCSSGSSTTPLVVTCPSSALTTTKCRSANAATWARCVTTTTWLCGASPASRRPISTATRPPTPASTSSNTNVPPGRSAASTTSRASRTRDSSPPEATLPRLRGSLPGFAAKSRSTASAPYGPRPVGVRAKARRACGIASAVSSAATAAANPSEAVLRRAVSRAARSRRSASCAVTVAVRVSIRSSEPSSSVSRAAAAADQASASSTVGPYERVSPDSAARRPRTHSSRAGSATRSSRLRARSEPRSSTRYDASATRWARASSAGSPDAASRLRRAADRAAEAPPPPAGSSGSPDSAARAPPTASRRSSAFCSRTSSVPRATSSPGSGATRSTCSSP